MATSKTEAEIEWLKSNLIPELLKNQDFKEDMKLKDDTSENVKIHNVQIKFIGAEESFMLTNCYRACITLEQSENNGPKTTTIIVKRTPKLSQDVFDSVQFGALFSNEILTYRTIVSELEKFTEQTIEVPRFYYGDLGQNYATLVLKDFGIDNWRLSKKKVNLSLGHTLIALGSLGKFHGIGFALRHKNPDTFHRITKGLKESRYDLKEMPPEWGTMVQTGAERVVIATQKYQPQLDVKFLKQYQRLIKEFILFGQKMMKPVEPLVTLCHGDYLRNNIAFKYINNNEEPTDSLMFDLQTMRICSPMLDFSIFLSLSCYTDIRHKHFDQIFNEYYNKLTKTFKEHTQEDQIPEYLSRDSLLLEFMRYFPYSISIATHFLMQLVAPENLPSDDFFTQDCDLDLLHQDALVRGGEEVDRELSHQMKELWELTQKYNYDIFKGFDYL